MGYFLSLCSPNPSWMFAAKKLIFLFHLTIEASPIWIPVVSDNWICWSWVNPGPKIQNHKRCLFSSVFVSSFLSSCGMETAIRFATLARLDLPFYEYTGEFYKLAVATMEDDATFNHLFWLGANFHRSVDLPDTIGLSWKEGTFRCLGSIRARARAIPPSSLPAVPVASPLAPAPELLDTTLPLEFLVPILPAEPAPRQCCRGAGTCHLQARTDDWRWHHPPSSPQQGALKYPLPQSALKCLLLQSALKCPLPQSALQCPLLQSALQCPLLQSALQNS